MLDGIAGVDACILVSQIDGPQRRFIPYRVEARASSTVILSLPCAQRGGACRL